MIFRLLLPLLSLIFISACTDEQHNKNTQQKYSVLETPIHVKNAPDVMEIFSLSCGNCRLMENEIPKIETVSKTKIAKTHATFNENASFAAFIFYTAMIQTDNNPPKSLINKLFKYVQEEQTSSQEMNKSILSNIFTQYGLTSPFALNEDKKEALFAEMEKANEITIQSGITSVPTFVVKGKYIINTPAHKNAEEIASTISELMNMPTEGTEKPKTSKPL